MNFEEEREGTREVEKKKRKNSFAPCRSVKAKTPVKIFFQSSQNTAQMC